MKISILFLLITVLLGCNTKQSKNTTETEPELWSVKFAETVMYTADSLMNYHSSRPNFGYDIAFLGDAIYKLKDIDPKYAAYLKNHVDYFVNDDGSIKRYKMSDYNIDNIRPGNSIITLYQQYGDEKYRLGAETLVEQMKNHPRTNSGGFWHKKRYPYQMWLDGLYMASPFLTRYAKVFNQPQWFD
ncbi:MAG TPA: glycoside hydrolase family 88 protein, partial [Draconibacterium sp.]|nr:glycoside hydrolase family 88 protein [Draconibacterium sp.]